MKLRLEVQEAASILTISEGVGPENLPILKAGLNKLFQDNKKTVILDLSGVALESFQPASVMEEISGLKLWAAELGAQITVVSGIENFGDARDRNAAIALLSSPLGRLLALEGRLTLQLQKLEAHKAELATQIQTIESTSGDVLALKRENGDSKRRVAELEALVKERLAARTSLYGSPMVKLGMTAVNRVLISVLEREGILPVN